MDTDITRKHVRISGEMDTDKARKHVRISGEMDTDIARKIQTKLENRKHRKSVGRLKI